MPEQYESKILDQLGLVSGMCDELEIAETIDSIIEQDRDKRIVSIGQAVKAMILNGLGFVNHQLYLVPHFYRNKPTQRLIGGGIEPEHLNDDTLGRALDDLYEYGVSEAYSLVTARAMKKLELDMGMGHLDSTSFHVDGKYNSEDGAEEGVVHITQGYSRDHRPDLNQVVLGLMVENQSGIPVLMKPLNGNSSDKTEFGVIIKEHITQLKENRGLEYLVADSALYTEANIQLLDGAKWISRVPETIKEARQVIESADVKSMEIMDEHYRYKTLGSGYGGVPQRWLVVHSTHAALRGVQTVNKKISKESEKELRGFEELTRKEFACEPDAIKALSYYEKGVQYTGVSSFSIEKHARYDSAGRPKKGSTPDRMVYRISGALATSLEERQVQLDRKGCFIIATNELDEKKLPPERLLEGYKGRSKVEKGFRFLKDPDFLASSLYLKSPERIMALLMVMTLCLLVYSALEYRIRKELQEKNQTFPDQKGKPTPRPTAKWVFQEFVGIHLLKIAGIQEVILNLNDAHRLILNLLGERYGAFYS